jgi:hypothetical protein
VSGEEDVTTELLKALARLQQALVVKATEVESGGKLNEWRLEVLHYHDLSVSGYVDAVLPGTRGVVWAVEITRKGRGWTVERDITLHPEGSDPHLEYLGADQVTTHLPTVEFATSRALVESLERLVDELLQSAPPSESEVRA